MHATAIMTADQAHELLSNWAEVTSASAIEWYSEAAYAFQGWDNAMRNGERSKGAAYLYAALLHWAEGGDRYPALHRLAADTLWTLDALIANGQRPAAWR